MNIQNVVIGVVVVIAIYILYVSLFKDNTREHLLSMHDARKSITIDGSSLPDGATADYTYSIWLYISNWNYRVGEKKIILSRAKSGEAPAPEISLGSMLNNIEVSLGTYAEGHSGQAMTHTCTLENVPLQKWVNVIITLNNRALDIYLDGKLVRTCVMPGVPKMNSGVPLTVTPNGGFEGYASNLSYYSRAVNPREAYEIYREGPPGSSFLGGLINKYRLRIEFLKGDKVVNELDL
jgi:hypothetical protein